MVEVRGEVEREPALSATAKSVGEPVVISDVWSRSGSKYRTRGIVLLVINMLLFGGLGCFAFWLRTGYYVAPALDGYWSLLWQTCLPGSDSHTLTSLLTFPINLEEVPLQIVIHGLLLSALVSIPILVSILYRFYCCLPFVAAVGFLALMPWLALTLLGSCILASLKPFRFSFRYASASLGLILVVIYIVAVSAQSAPAASVLSNPGDRVKLVTPWILAVLASCVLLALGLGLAKLVNYRPGVIAPLLATMFALPVALFEEYVGRDELHYRLLEHRYGPKSKFFQNQDVHDAFDRGVWARSTYKSDQPYEAIAGLEELRWQLELESTPNRENLFTRHQEQAARECDWFVKYFPDSRYAPAVLYLKGRALDMRVNLAELRDHKKLVFYDTYPSIASRDTWRRLLKNAPEDSPFAAVALYRLGLLEAREGNVDQAIELLGKLQRFAEPQATAGTRTSPEGIKRLLKRAPPESGLRISVEGVVFEGKRLLSILENNRGSLYGSDPLCGPKSGVSFPRKGWLLFDPHSEHYRQNLTNLLKRYPDCDLTDNVEVELARACANPRERIALLKQCIDKHADQNGVALKLRDAVPEALYRLGESYLTVDKPAEARRAFERLVGEHPGSFWRERAETCLTTPGSAAAPAGP